LVRDALGHSRTSYRRQGRAAATEITGGVYSVASVAVVGAVAGAGVTAAFISADRLFRAALMPVSALSSSLQRAVSEADRATFRHEARRAFGQHLALGLVGGVALALWGRPATALLFGDAFAAPRAAMVAYGAAFLAIALNTTLGRHVLASQGRGQALLLGTSGGVGVGIVGLVVGATQYGVTGAAVGVALGELATLSVFAGACLRGAPQSARLAPSMSA
jgi:PST family polysaccharide transporter